VDVRGSNPCAPKFVFDTKIPCDTKTGNTNQPETKEWIKGPQIARPPFLATDFIYHDKRGKQTPNTRKGMFRGKISAREILAQ
jgi:hypothetical protein